jgi:hypothetical protein
MPSTKSLKETVHLRIGRNPAFRLDLFQEARSALYMGDMPLGKTMLRDILNRNYL